MHRYQINMRIALELQKWALKESKTKKILSTLPELPKRKIIEQGIYVDYSLDKSEFYGGIDYPDIGVANIYAVLTNKKIWLGDVRAYNFEMFWLETREDDEVDTADNWWKIILNDYEKNKRS